LRLARLSYATSWDGTSSKMSLIRTITDEAAFDALKPEWDELYRKSSDPYYSQSFEWCRRAWTEVGRPRGRKLHILVGAEDGRVVLIWPLALYRRFLWSFACPLGPETSEYSSVLVEDSPEADRRTSAAWQQLRHTAPCDVLLLPFVRDGSALHRLISAKSVFAFSEKFTTSQVDRAGSRDWETYYRSLRKKQRLDINRRRRRLTEIGKVTFEAAVEAGQLTAVIDWIVGQKRQWLVRTKRLSSWFETDEYRNFLVAIAGQTAHEGRVIVSALKLDGRVIAAAVGRIEGARVETFLSAFDPSFRIFSPSHILYEEFLKWSFERRLEVDFRIGNEDFKDHWRLLRSGATSYEIPFSPWGIAFVVLRRARLRWRKLAGKLYSPLRARSAPTSTGAISYNRSISESPVEPKNSAEDGRDQLANTPSLVASGPQTIAKRLPPLLEVEREKGQTNEEMEAARAAKKAKKAAHRQKSLAGGKAEAPLRK
jgi:CelD/BcsL family acetyltransferase involved in cellulose biosynthesis